MENKNLQKDILEIRQYALDAVDPGQALKRALFRRGFELCAGSRMIDLQRYQNIYLIAIGKAAMPMAEQAVQVIGDALTAGVIITKYGHSQDFNLPGILDVYEAGHPVPDEAGLKATVALECLLDGKKEDDLILALISGGASALLPAPATGLSLNDLQVTTQYLLKAGASIGEINSIRKHLDRLKGGQLLRRLQPAQVIALVLSDVVGDSLDVIASGLTAPDPSTFTDALAVLDSRGLLNLVPAGVRSHLEQGAAGNIAETPKVDDELFARVDNIVVGSNRVAALAAKRKAEQLGYSTLLLTSLAEGEAREIAVMIAAIARSIQKFGDPVSSPACIIIGGESTVTIHGSGRGGRNQELALAAAIRLDGVRNIKLMSLATDGSDGPTDAAGGIVDGDTVRQMRAAGIDPLKELRDNDAYLALDVVNALMRIGPTGTNVNDLVVLLTDVPE